MRAEVLRQPGVDDRLDAGDRFGAHVVDAALVERDDNRGDRAVFGHEIAADQLVVERPLADLGRRSRLEILGQPANVEEVGVAASGARPGVDDRDGAEAVDALDGRHSLDVGRDLVEEIEALAAEQPIAAWRLDRDDQRAGAAEFVAKALVFLVDRIVAREPRGEIVVDVGDVGARREHGGANQNQRGEQTAPAVQQRGERVAHRMPRSSSRRLTSSGVRPTSYSTFSMTSSVRVRCSASAIVISSTVQ